MVIDVVPYIVAEHMRLYSQKIYTHNASGQVTSQAT